MITRLIVIGWTIFIGWAFLSGVADVASQQPSGLGAQFDTNVVGFAMMVSAITHFALWCAVCVPAYIFHRMFEGVFSRRDVAEPAPEVQRRRPVA